LHHLEEHRNNLFQKLSAPTNESQLDPVAIVYLRNVVNQARIRSAIEETEPFDRTTEENKEEPSLNHIRKMDTEHFIDSNNDLTISFETLSFGSVNQDANESMSSEKIISEPMLEDRLSKTSSSESDSEEASDSSETSNSESDSKVFEEIEI